jgi:hypothetical protein
MAGLPLEDRLAWQQLEKSREKGANTLIALAEYWADGRRTALDVIEMVELESGIRDAELVVRRFELLARLGLLKNYSG